MGIWRQYVALAPGIALQEIITKSWQGSLRCDVNVSVGKLDEPFGTRCEIKNLNSVRFMTIALGPSNQILNHGLSLP